jgi:hypothetical protein
VPDVDAEVEDAADDGDALDAPELEPFLSGAFALPDVERSPAAAPSPDEAASRVPLPPAGAEPSAPASDAAAAFVLEELAELRSFLAQPDPLKWIDGAENALRTGDAAHTGHSVGPGSSIRWIASKRCPFGQRYSYVGMSGPVVLAQPRRRRMPHFGQ